MLLFVSLILGFISLATSLAGIILPYWLYLDKDGRKVHEGLWKECVKQPQAYEFVCDTFGSGSVTITMKATWALEMVGVVLISLALLSAILHLTVLKQWTVMPYASGILQMIAGICIIIGTLLYLLQVRDEKDPTHRYRHIDTGWGVAMGGGGSAFIFGIFYFAAARKAITYDKK